VSGERSRCAKATAFADLAKVVVDTERRGRGEWIGGVDVHDAWFDGITQQDDGVWTISWGSQRRGGRH